MDYQYASPSPGMLSKPSPEIADGKKVALSQSRAVKKAGQEFNGALIGILLALLLAFILLKSRTIQEEAPIETIKLRPLTEGTYTDNKLKRTRQLPPSEGVMDKLNPEIIVNGNKVNDPAHAFDGALDEITTLASLSHLYKIRKTLESKTSHGETIAFNLTVDSNLLKHKFDVPVQSVALINTGINSTKFWLNGNGHTPRILRPKVPTNLNFEDHVIYKLFFQCNPGETTTVEVTTQS